MNLSKHKFIDYWESKHNDPNYAHGELNDFIRDQIRLLSIDSNHLVLDHGCGQGRVSLELATYSRNLVINDISLAAITATQKKLGHLDYPIRPKAFCMDIYELPVKFQFNRIVSHRVLHTMPKYERLKCLRFLFDNLESGGCILISAKSVTCSRYELLKEDKNFVMVDGSSSTFFRSNPFRFIHYYSEEGFVEELESAGFDVSYTKLFSEDTGNRNRNPATRVNDYVLAKCYKR